MQDITIITKLYKLIEMMGKDEVNDLLDKAIKEYKKQLKEDHVMGDVQDQRKREYELWRDRRRFEDDETDTEDIIDRRFM